MSVNNNEIKDPILQTTEALYRESTELKSLLDKHSVDGTIKTDVGTFLDTYLPNTRLLNPKYADFKRESENLKQRIKQFFEQEIEKNKNDRTKKEAIESAAKETNKKIELLESLRENYEHSLKLKASQDVLRALNIADENKYPLVAAINKQGQVDPEFKQKSEDALQKAQNTYNIKEIGTINGRMHFYAEVNPEHPELAAASGAMLVNTLAGKGATDITLSYSGNFEQLDAAYKQAIKLGMVFKIETDWSYIIKTGLLSPVSMLLSGAWSATKLANVKSRSAPYVAISEEFTKLKSENKNTGDPLVVYKHFTKTVDDSGNPIPQHKRDKNKEHLEYYLPLLDREQIDSLFQRVDSADLNTLISDLKAAKKSSLNSLPLVGQLFDKGTPILNQLPLVGQFFDDGSSVLRNLSLTAVAARADIFAAPYDEIKEILTAQGKDATDPRPAATPPAVNAAPANFLDRLIINLTDEQLSSLKLNNTQINPATAVITQTLTTKAKHLSPELRLLAINNLANHADVNAVVANMTDEQAKELDFTKMVNIPNLDATSLKKIFKDKQINDAFATHASTLGAIDLVPLCQDGLSVEQQNTLLQNSNFGAGALNTLIQAVNFSNSRIRQISNDTLCARMIDLDATSLSKILTAKGTTISSFVNSLSDAELKKLKLSATQVTQIQPVVLKNKAQHFNETTVAAIIGSHSLQNDDLNQFINAANNDSLKTIDFNDIDFYFDQLNNASLNKVLTNKDADGILTFWISPPPPPPGAPAAAITPAMLAKQIKIIDALSATKVATIFSLDANPNIQNRADILNGLTFNNEADDAAAKSAKIDAVLSGLSQTQVENVFQHLMTKPNKNSDVLAHLIKNRIPGPQVTALTNANFKAMFDVINQLNSTAINSTTQLDQLLFRHKANPPQTKLELTLLSDSFLEKNAAFLSKEAVDRVNRKNKDLVTRFFKNPRVTQDQKLTLFQKLDQSRQHEVLVDDIQNKGEFFKQSATQLSGASLDGVYTYFQANPLANQTNAVIGLFNNTNLRPNDKFSLFKKLSPANQTAILVDPDLKNDDLRQEVYKRATDTERAVILNAIDNIANVQTKASLLNNLIFKIQADHITQQRSEDPSDIRNEDSNFVKEMTPLLEKAITNRVDLDKFIPKTQNVPYSWNDQPTSVRPHARVDRITYYLAVKAFFENSSVSNLDKKQYINDITNGNIAFDNLQPELQVFLFEQPATYFTLQSKFDLFGSSNEKTCLNLLASNKLPPKFLDDAYTYYGPGNAGQINPIIKLLNSSNLNYNEKIAVLKHLSSDHQLEVLAHKDLDDNFRQEVYQQSPNEQRDKILQSLDKTQTKALLLKTMSDHISRQSGDKPVLSWIQANIPNQEDEFKKEIEPIIKKQLIKDPTVNFLNGYNNQRPNPSLFTWNKQQMTVPVNARVDRLVQNVAYQTYFESDIVTDDKNQTLSKIMSSPGKFDQYHPELQIYLFDRLYSLNAGEATQVFQNASPETQVNLLRSTKLEEQQKITLASSLTNTSALVDALIDQSVDELKGKDLSQQKSFFKAFRRVLMPLLSTKAKTDLEKAVKDPNHKIHQNAKLSNYAKTALTPTNNNADLDDKLDAVVNTPTPTLSF